MATHAFNPSMQKAEARWILGKCEASLEYREFARTEILSQKTKNNNNNNNIKIRYQPWSPQVCTHKMSSRYVIFCNFHLLG